MRGQSSGFGTPLSPRLLAVADLLPKTEVIADIGCDHGQLSAHLLRSGQCARVICSDISPRCVVKAQALMEQLGLNERAQIVCASGLQGAGEAQAAAIAGMGGNTIVDILRDGEGMAHAIPLVLQPASDADTLRTWLCAQGYAIEQERLVKQGGRFYPLLRVRYSGITAELSELEALIGPRNLERNDGITHDYVRWLCAVYRKATKQLATSDGGRQRQMQAARRLALLEQALDEGGNS